MSAERRQGLHPNLLRRLRGAAHLTQADLSRLTHQVAAEIPATYRGISVSGIEKLEAGTSRPRPATARAIAKVLACDLLDVFPLGTLAADFVPNPEGRTNVGRPNHGKRGPGKSDRSKSSDNPH